MTFPHAYQGIWNIRTSLILTLFASFLVAASCITRRNPVAVTVLTVAGLAFLLAGMILYIIGIVRAEADERSFSKALIFVVFSFLCSLFQVFFPNSVIAKIILSIGEISFSFGATILIILGIRSLAEQCKSFYCVNRSNTVMRILIAIFILSIVLGVIPQSYQTMPFIAVGALVLSIVRYAVSMSFLRDALEMLES